MSNTKDIGDAFCSAVRACLLRLSTALGHYVEEIKRLWTAPDSGARTMALLMVGFAVVCTVAVAYVIVFLLPLLLLAALLLALYRAIQSPHR